MLHSGRAYAWAGLFLLSVLKINVLNHGGESLLLLGDSITKIILAVLLGAKQAKYSVEWEF